MVGEHERAHVAFLESALGTRRGPGAVLRLRRTRRRIRERFTAAAVALEDIAVAAYNGQATNLTNGRARGGHEIVSVEARHAGLDPQHRRPDRGAGSDRRAA